MLKSLWMPKHPGSELLEYRNKVEKGNLSRKHALLTCNLKSHGGTWLTLVSFHLLVLLLPGHTHNAVYWKIKRTSTPNILLSLIT